MKEGSGKYHVLMWGAKLLERVCLASASGFGSEAPDQFQPEIQTIVGLLLCVCLAEFKFLYSPYGQPFSAHHLPIYLLPIKFRYFLFHRSRSWGLFLDSILFHCFMICSWAITKLHVNYFGLIIYFNIWQGNFPFSHSALFFWEKSLKFFFSCKLSKYPLTPNFIEILEGMILNSQISLERIKIFIMVRFPHMIMPSIYIYFVTISVMCSSCMLHSPTA